MTPPLVLVSTDELRALIRQEVTRALASGVYSTRKGHEPPGFSRRRWLALAPKIPGSVRRGRWVTVTAEQLAEFEKTHPPKKSSRVIRGPWTPGAALAAAGARGAK